MSDYHLTDFFCVPVHSYNEKKIKMKLIMKLSLEYAGINKEDLKQIHLGHQAMDELDFARAEAFVAGFEKAKEMFMALDNPLDPWFEVLRQDLYELGEEEVE